MEHLEQINPQSVQMSGHDVLLEMKRSGKDMSALVSDSFTGMCDDQPVVCAGFVEMWKGRASVWAVFDDSVKSNIFMSIHRQVLKAIDAYQPNVFWRLEMTVLSEFRKAHRWAKMLGFVRKCELEKYDHFGRDYTLYDRVK